MKNETEFVKKVLDASTIRVEMDEEETPYYGRLKKIFKFAFGASGSTFKYINDNIFYKGSYPKEDSPPKIKAELDKFGYLYRFYQLRGNEDAINGYLKENFGIEIDGTGPCKFLGPNLKNKKKFEPAWQEVFGKEYDNEDKKVIFNKLVDEAQKTTASICTKSDSIKIEAATEVKLKCDVKKPAFMASVGLKATQIKKGKDEVDEKLSDIMSARNEVDELVQVLFPEEN